MESWSSPDNKIKKVIIKEGEYGNKPTECCQCKINITDSSVNSENISNIRCIGDTDSEFTRLLDITLQMMNVKEIARITFSVDIIVEFTLELCDFKFNGFIYEWSAEKKYEIASHYKTRGINFIKNNDVKNASHQFSRGLKILLTIPYNAEEQPTCFNELSLSDLNLFKSIFYSNLAFCYLKVNDFERVVNLCKKALTLDSRNIKALYRLGTGYYELRYYDEAESTLIKALGIEPDNTAILNMLKMSRVKLNQENAKFNEIVKKMFQ